MTIDQPSIIPLWPNGAPGSEDWSQREQLTPPSATLNIPIVRNVTQPTLTAYLPDPAHATGMAVVICPGGAYHLLAIEHEGTAVAQWLNARGIAAFVLRYRLLKTPVGDEEFHQHMRETMADHNRLDALATPLFPLIIADGKQALRVVRQHATEWHITPTRVGIMGFSAGGMVTTGTATQYDPESRPDFAAPIYSAPCAVGSIPADAPPLFMALASNDQMAVQSSIPLYSAWQAAGHSAELHIYANGGHGFGMNKQGLPTDQWIDRFGDWLMAL
jgi:acetyl esterase/lipase